MGFKTLPGLGRRKGFQLNFNIYLVAVCCLVVGVKRRGEKGKEYEEEEEENREACKNT